jgi:hypothetical protein
MTLQEAMSLNTGEFVGKLVHKSDDFLELKCIRLWSMIVI